MGSAYVPSVFVSNPFIGVFCIIVSYKSSNLIVFIGSGIFVALGVLFATDRV